MENNDTTYDFYAGNNGKSLEECSEKRMNWILDSAGRDKNILVVGCSQGIISILMAENGNTVDAIDTRSDVVEFANRLLNEKYPSLAQKVSFINADFFEFDEKKQYDTLVMTEILENLENPCVAVERAKRFLKNDGRLIITVPFGVNRYNGHINTFYLTDILDIAGKYFYVEKIQYVSRWMGLIAVNAEEKKFGFSREILKAEEENFYLADSELTLKNEELCSKADDALKKYKELGKTCAKLREKCADCRQNYIKATEDCKRFKESNADFCGKYKLSCENYDRLKERYANVAGKLEKLTEIIKSVYDTNDEAIADLKQCKAIIIKLKSQNSYLKSENMEYKRKLSLITDTFLGKIGIKGYKMLKKIKNKLK